MGKELRKWRNLLIHPKFQLTLIGLNAGLVFLTCIFFWVTVHNLLSDLEPVAALSGIETTFYQNYLDACRSRANAALFTSSAITLLIISSATLLLSHRLAGPIVRLRNFFNMINQGVKPTPKLTFRDGDFCEELAPLINEAISKLESGGSERRGEAVG